MTLATSLLEAFSTLPDPRLEGGKEHRWSELLFIGVGTLLTGGESFSDMEDFAVMRQQWLRTFLALPGGPPSHDTFNRLFQALDPAAFAETFATWTEGLRARLAPTTAGREIVALDGKAAKRALNAGPSARCLVSAWATELGLTLGQVPVADKSNEITAVPALLRALELGGGVVSADALHCQRNTAKEIKAADADDVRALKANQGTAHAESKDYLDEAIARALPELAAWQSVEKGHGRIETRRYWQSARLDWFADKGAWEGWQSVGVVEASGEVGDQVERGAALLPEPPAGGHRPFCPGRARALGGGKQPALDARRGLRRRPKPRAHGLCRGQPGRGPAPGLEPPAPGQNAQPFHQEKTTAGGLRCGLPSRPAEILMRQPWRSRGERLFERAARSKVRRSSAERRTWCFFAGMAASLSPSTTLKKH